MFTDWTGKFPNLKDRGYRRTSPPDSQYNCFAWAAGDVANWWEPSTMFDFCYWPEGVACKPTIGAYVAAFKTLGFRRCDDGELEDGFEKIAIYTNERKVEHAARQLADGQWTSKLGGEDDISHSLEGLAGSTYGQPTVFLKRPRP